MTPLDMGSKRKPPSRPPDPPRVKRLKKPNAKSHFTIKIGFNSLCTVPQLKGPLNRAVREVSLITWELSKLLNLYYLDACENDKEIFYLSRRQDNDFYSIVQGISHGSKYKVRDLGSAGFSARINAVAEAQAKYHSLRPSGLPWGSRDGTGQFLKSACEVFWDNCSQDQMANFEKRLTQWWLGEVNPSRWTC